MLTIITLCLKDLLPFRKAVLKFDRRFSELAILVYYQGSYAQIREDVPGINDIDMLQEFVYPIGKTDVSRNG